MWSLKLSKEKFKFSASHFTIFSATNAERLHGHNYYVELELSGASKLSNGLIVDLNQPKKKVVEILEALDEKILIAEKNSYCSIQEQEKNIEVCFYDKFYSFPKEDCCILPLENISIEELAKEISERLKEDFAHLPIKNFTVSVAESRGQSASFLRELKAEGAKS